MVDKLHIPELDRLARELESGSGATGTPPGLPGPDDATSDGASKPMEPRSGAPGPATLRVDEPRSPVQEGEPLHKLLAEMLARQATDLLLIPGSPPVLRVNGQLATMGSQPVESDAVWTMMSRHLSGRNRRAFEESGACDLSMALGATTVDGAAPGGRFRVNVHRQRGTVAATLRALPRQIPTLKGLHLPAGLAELAKVQRGLVVVSGPTGSGKTSTLAALVGEINRTRSCHVITIEDPIEYEHRNGRSLIEQVEVGTDTESFPAALRASLRQNPDVILVGEIRDLETVATALSAAETGHLILTSLHTSDVSQAIHRIVDIFPPAQQGQVRQQLALSLHAIVCQQLLPRADGSGRVPAVEVMMANYAVRQHIRKEQLQNLYNEITLGKRHGMITFEESLGELANAGAITVEEARIRSSHPQELERFLRV